MPPARTDKKGKPTTTKMRSCGPACARNYPATGAIAHIYLKEHQETRQLTSWKGFKVLAVFCGQHASEATHNLVDPKRDARRFAVGAFVGRQTVKNLCSRRPLTLQ